MPTKTKILFALVAIAIFAGMQIPSKLLYAKTNSVGYRLFYYERDQKVQAPQKDAFVVFTLKLENDERCKDCRVVKKVGCLAGDTLTTTFEGLYYCNGQYLGSSQKYSPSGKKQIVFVYNDKVPANKFFAFGGGSKYSYDSRYYGFIDADKIEGIAIPLF